MSDKEFKMKKYSVSLVYLRIKNEGGVDIALAVSIVDSVCENEALGKVISECVDRLNQFSLSTFKVIEITT